MEAETFRRVHPHEYYRRFLSENVRPDGRALLETRETVVDTECQPSALASSVVRIGKTTVVCTMLAEFATPEEAAPEAGFVVPTVTLSPVCVADGRWGTNEDAQALTSFLDTTLRRADVVDASQLCVVAGKIVWTLYAEIVCLDNDGALEDACLLALMAALRNVQLPAVDVDEDAGSAIPSATRKTPLRVANCPLAMSFSVFDESILVADPTWTEGELSTARVTVVMDELGRICGLVSFGKSGLSDEQLRQCVARTRDRVAELRAQLN